MEKFIKDYGILILVGVAVYWFFIRKKDEEVVVIDEEGSSYRTRGGRMYSTDKGDKCPCEDNPSLCPTGCKDCFNCNDLEESVGRRGVRRPTRRPRRRYY